jgi:hypothetical protein
MTLWQDSPYPEVSERLEELKTLQLPRRCRTSVKALVATELTLPRGAGARAPASPEYEQCFPPELQNSPWQAVEALI